MKTKMYSLMLAALIGFSACQKENELIQLAETTNEISTSGIKFIYHDQEILKESIDTGNSNLSMFVESNERVYVFDNNEDFLQWASKSAYAEEIEKLNAKEQLAVEYAKENGVIEEYEKSGIVKQSYIDYLNSLNESESTSKEKSLLLSYLSSGENLSGTSVIIQPMMACATLPVMNNIASSYATYGMVTFFDGTFFTGQKVYSVGNGTVVNFASIGFDNRTSSLLSI